MFEKGLLFNGITFRVFLRALELSYNNIILSGFANNY